MTSYRLSSRFLLIFLCIIITKSSHLADRKRTSVDKIEKTLDSVIDFFRKTKESTIYKLYEDFSQENTNDRAKECVLKPSNCADLQLMGFKKNGIYEVYPKGQKDTNPFSVFCDFQTDGGGWTVFQRRGDFGDPKENFFRTWEDYKIGFGDLNKEFWLGNEKLSLLTNNDRMILRIDLEDFENSKKFAQYTDFLVKGESELFLMSYNRFNGDAGDSLARHNGQPFATIDKDTKNECAKQFKGGWWYQDCHNSNLNGLYFSATDMSSTICTNWYHFKEDRRCMKSSEMKIRPQYFAELPL